MNVEATFELHPSHDAVCRSRHGSEPCAPPVATLRSRLDIGEADLLGLVASKAISREAPGLPARAWVASVGCAFAPSCAWHRQGALHLRAATPGLEADAATLASLAAAGWRVDAEAVASYRPG